MFTSVIFQLHECVGSAVSAMGPEAFLSLQPLNVDAEYASDANVWLLPILKQYIVGAHLSFFLQYILGKVKVIQQRSLKVSIFSFKKNYLFSFFVFFSPFL